jgi:acyl carrier protein
MNPADNQGNQLNQVLKIKSILSDHLGIAVQDLTPNADLREDLNAEELEIADLLMKLEKELAIRISREDAKRIKTVGDILEYFQD